MRLSNLHLSTCTVTLVVRCRRAVCLRSSATWQLFLVSQQPAPLTTSACTADINCSVVIIEYSVSLLPHSLHPPLLLFSPVFWIMYVRYKHIHGYHLDTFRGMRCLNVLTMCVGVLAAFGFMLVGCFQVHPFLPLSLSLHSLLSFSCSFSIPPPHLHTLPLLIVSSSTVVTTFIETQQTPCVAQLYCLPFPLWEYSHCNMVKYSSECS